MPCSSGAPGGYAPSTHTHTHTPPCHVMVLNPHVSSQCLQATVYCDLRPQTHIHMRHALLNLCVLSTVHQLPTCCCVRVCLLLHTGTALPSCLGCCSSLSPFTRLLCAWRTVRIGWGITVGGATAGGSCLFIQHIFGLWEVLFPQRHGDDHDDDDDECQVMMTMMMTR